MDANPYIDITYKLSNVDPQLYSESKKDLHLQLSIKTSLLLS
uniref:Uncharacterized protein n=1 Tax=Lepeophtheirus salmonis TaxID=72036 RepID=A0A0K2VCM0_LEPSM